MTVHLLDANILIALAWPQHVHHTSAHEWFERIGHKTWATCPLTQLAFVRISSNPRIIPEAVTPREATIVLAKIIAHAGHHFWPDDIALLDAEIFASVSLVGHRQVTDGYLLTLARHHKGKLATFDRGIPELLPEEKTRYVTVIDGRYP